MQLTTTQIVNRVMAAVLAVIVAPQLAKLDVHLSPDQYATLAATLATVAFGIYHHFELQASANAKAAPVTNTQLAAVVRAVVAELRSPQSVSSQPENPGKVPT